MKDIKSMGYTFKVFKESSGFWAQCNEHPGICTQGATIPELRKRIVEALEAFLDAS